MSDWQFDVPTSDSKRLSPDARYMDALTSQGYGYEVALVDLEDNSIDAGAQDVVIHFPCVTVDPHWAHKLLTRYAAPGHVAVRARPAHLFGVLVNPEHRQAAYRIACDPEGVGDMTAVQRAALAVVTR